MIDPEDEGAQQAAITYLSDLEPDERTEERDGDDVRVSERFDGPFEDDAPALLRRASMAYVYTNYSDGGEVPESQEVDIYSDDDELDE